MSTILLRGRYYSRVIVPVVLRPLIGRAEIRKSLRTRVYSDARILAGRWEGRLAHLFTTLRTRGVSMTLEQIKRLVQVYITEELEEREVGRMGHKNGGDDAERDTIALVITSSLDDTAEQLQRNDYRRISKDVDELLQRHRRTLSKSSEAYHRLCRELLKAKQYVLKKELDRQDGLYFADFASPGGIGDGATVVMESSRLISDVLPEYFKTYDNRRERTNKGKARRLERFIECVGDKPLAEVTKTDCKLF